MDNTKWEYLVESTYKKYDPPDPDNRILKPWTDNGFGQSTADMINAYLNEKGEEGWELITTSPFYVFKRPMQ